MRLRNFVANQLPLLLWAASIFVLSGTSKFPVTQTPLGLDKVAHFILFFVMCGLGWRAFFHQSVSAGLKNRALLYGFIVAVAYGALDELHQYFVPARSPEFYDLLADAAGALGYVAWHRFRSGRQGKSPGGQV